MLVHELGHCARLTGSTHRPAPLTTSALTNISPLPTTIVDVIYWLRMIAAKATSLAGFGSAIMLAFWV